jgi:hypothetical protein
MMALAFHKSYILNILISGLMAERLQTIEQGNHIIAVYPNKEEKFNEPLLF